MSSDAVGSERVSSVVGYKIAKGNFNNTAPNLPQRIALLGEANTANQGSLVNDGTLITSAKQAGELYGFGSPIHMEMRILRPINGDGVGGIPVYVYAQDEAGGATARVMTISPVGTATKNGTHTILIAGREELDGERYDISVAVGDTAAQITQKIEDTVSNVLGCPMTCSSTSYEAILTTKWKGLTAQTINVSVDNNGDDLGISYSVVETTAGTGTPSITFALTSFGSSWNTLVVNTYGTESTTMDSLESYNGIPDPSSPTGRYAGIVMKPFIALTGSVADDPSSVTDTRLNDVTIAICPAPLSAGHAMEAAANMCVLFARKSQDTPHLDVQGMSYPDMPTPTAIGSMSDYSNRDVIVKKGCSTVELSGGKYKVTDFVTTYHPVGETPPQFRYCRNIMLDLNVFFGYYLMEQTFIVGKTIAGNNDAVDVAGVIKPKDWIQKIGGYADDLVKRALITDAAFMQDSIECDISSANPDRLETTFNYKRTGTARIAATTATAGFNFGS